MSDAILMAIIAAISGGAAAALIGGIFQRPKTRAESKKIAAEAGEVIEKRWQTWAEALERKVAELEVKLNAKEHEVVELREGLNKEKLVTRLVIAWALVMRDEIRRLGGQPADPPSEVQQYLDGIN